MTVPRRICPASQSPLGDHDAEVVPLLHSAVAYHVSYRVPVLPGP